MRKGVWTKSRKCDTNACVEVAVLDTTPEVAVTLAGHLEVHEVEDGVLVRNSAVPDREVHFTLEEWDTFLADAKAFAA